MYKEQILSLREKGKTYKEIVEILGCSKSTVSYHCNPNVKRKVSEKTRKRRKKFGRHKRDNLYSKINRAKNTSKDIRILHDKLKQNKNPIFYKRYNALKKGTKLIDNWTVKDLLNKIGHNPKCYLSGRLIDLEESSTYHLDHIIPVSKGGSNELDNINITVKEANLCKSNLTVEELLLLCKDILEYNGYIIVKQN